MSEKTGPDLFKRTYPMPEAGHELPQEAWDKVVADAERIRAEAGEGGPQ